MSPGSTLRTAPCALAIAVDDREPKAKSVMVARSVGSKALKRLDKPVDLERRYWWTGVGHPQRGTTGTGSYRHVDAPVRNVVTKGILHEVRHETLDEPQIADDLGRL